MTSPVSRAVVEQFYRAYVSRDPERIGATLDDDVEWHVAGPVEVMHVCGFWRGKAAVTHRFTHIVPKIIELKRLDIESLLVDGDSSAMFGRIACLQLASGRSICHRTAHIVRYRDDKVIFFRVINDTLDAAEQYVGHHINLTDETIARCDDLVAV